MCSSLAMQPPKEQARIIEAARTAGITVVSLPLVNEWTQVSCSEVGEMLGECQRMNPALPKQPVVRLCPCPWSANGGELASLHTLSTG